MGFIFGLLKRLIKWMLYFAIFAAIIILIPNLPPYTKFTSIEIEPTQPRVGPLAVNGDLNNVEKLYKDKLLGPEAFQVWNGEVYTSLATGEIVKISPGGHVTFVTKLGDPCTGLAQEHICGRPLGFQIDEKNKLMYVADSYRGIWKVDLKTDKKQLLVSPRVEISSRQPKLFNSIALAGNGDLYWTDSSSDFNLKDGAFTVLADPSGRLFHYNAVKNQSKVLLDDLWFPNGLIMSPDNQFLVVAETARLRVMKYYIDGPKKGKSEVFVAGLPGAPDNLRALPDGSGMLVALYTVFDDNHPLITKTMAQTPLIRKFLARVQRLIEIPFEFLNSQYPHPIFEDIVYNIGHFKSVAGFAPGMSGLVQVDWNGNIVASYYNTDGTMGAISDAVVHNDKLYMGSPHGHNFIGAVPVPPLLKKAFASTKTSPPTKETPKAKVEAKPQQSKPVETAKPKVEEKIVTPKVAKPVVQEPPKPKPTAKPEAVKTTTPKPEAVKTTTPKPETVKTTTPKPDTVKTTTPKSETVKTTTPKPETVKTTTPKPETPKVTTPKPVENKPSVEPKAAPAAKPTAQAAKPAESKPATPNHQASSKTQQTATKPNTPPKEEVKTTPPKLAETKPKAEKSASKPAQTEESKTKKSGANPLPDQIPIVEEIPSDTAKPSKEKLKVIKKDGPTEIPNLNP